MNNIDKILTLSDNTKYMVLDQGNYQGKQYYLTSKLDLNDNLTEEFTIIEDNNNKVSTVNDKQLFDALIEYFNKRLA